jgi:hypothetical protein
VTCCAFRDVLCCPRELERRIPFQSGVLVLSALTALLQGIISSIISSTVSTVTVSSCGDNMASVGVCRGKDDSDQS